MQRNHYVFLVVLLLIGIAVARILQTYKVTAQAFDEPCHVAAAIELLDKGTYTLDPVHPPLSRIAIGIPLYLAGARFPDWPADDPRVRNYNDVGNSIFNHGGMYLRNLSLARVAILPFFALVAVMVFLWTRQEFGDISAVMAVALFTTLPNVLAFSGLAYTDLPAACMQFAALFVFVTWLQKPGLRWSLALGVTAALAFLAKMTTLLFLPAAGVAIVFGKWLIEGRAKDPRSEDHVSALRSDGKAWRPARLAAALASALIVVWACYGFSVGHVREAMQISPESMPSFQHFPGPAQNVARAMVQKDILLPAPALFRGAAMAWVLNKSAPPAYLLGRVKNGGWWYFFFVGVGVKAPLAFLLLCLAGLWAICSRAIFSRPRRWQAVAPVLSVAAILFVTMFVKYNAGTRHVMVIFPLLAVIAGCGCGFLWNAPEHRRIVARSALAVLLLWQGVSSFGAAPDYIAYFNELAGRDPGQVLLAGCDLDCGQDMFRLSRALHERNISQVNLAIWSSADMSQMDLPAFTMPPPFTPVSGWIAISRRSLRLGDLFHLTYPPGAFDWLERFQPVGTVGKTILLYHVPDNPVASVQKEARDSTLSR